MADERGELERLSPPDKATPAHSDYSKATGYPDAYSRDYGYGRGDQGIHLRELFRLVRKRKWLIIVLIAIVTTILTIEAYRTSPIYQASAKIEIGKENRSLVQAGELIQDDSDWIVPMVSLRTSMEILKSRPVLEEVVTNLELDQKSKFLNVTPRRSMWEAIRSIVRKESSPGQDEATRAMAEVRPAPMESKLARSLEESARLQPYVDLLEGALKTEPIRETRIIAISYTHTDPTIAAAVANGVAQVFIDRGFRNKTEKFTYTSEWLDEMTRKLKARVEQAEQALANYTRENNIFSTDSKSTLTTDKLSHLHEQAAKAEMDRIIKESLYQQAQAGRVAQLPEAFADPKTAELQRELGRLAVTAAQLDLKFGPENLKVTEIRQQMATIEKQIEESRQGLEEKIKADYERAVSDEQAFKAALARAKVEATQQNQAAIQFNLLNQEVNTAKQLYTDFLQKTHQARVQVAEQQNNLRLIEPARVPQEPVGPKRMLMILTGFFVSLIAGIGLVFFLEYLDNTVKSVEDIDRYLQLPTLGVIPVIPASAPQLLSAKKKSQQKLVAGNGSVRESTNGSFELEPGWLMTPHERSSAAEAYRALRTSVLLSAAGGPPKTILVTSSTDGEGKTTTALNTAISLAQLGASVLLIDCDLRWPKIHKAMGVDQARGLSTYLSRNIEPDELIYQLQIPNLSLIPCGPIPPNPAELIGSDKMKDLLQMLAEHYDHILLDSPPLIRVTDPVILSTLVDGVVLVVHGGKSTREVARRARQELASVGAKIFGVVLNNVDLRCQGYDDYYYYRYYHDHYRREKEITTD
jgi:capsular exopolysaccharide synthesis family protein